MGEAEVQKHSVHTLVFRSLKRTHDMFLSDQANLPASEIASEDIRRKCKISTEYGLVQHLPTQREIKQQQNLAVTGQYGEHEWEGDGTRVAGVHPYPSGPGLQLTDATSARPPGADMALVLAEGGKGADKMKGALVPKKAPTMPKPTWHPPWKLYRVISGHLGWVRCITVEPGNEWFVTGAGDRVIKIWDLASGTLKLSLTGHISSVRGLAVSSRQPYLFSAGEDKQVKCWDLEYNKVVRHYHGHLSAIYSLDLHPTIDVIVTCGRDASTRVWDMRTAACVHTLTGHTNTVAEVKCQAAEPQIITGSHDCTVRLWDLAAGKSLCTLTNHKKSVRALALHPTKYMFASGSPDNIKEWKFPEGNFQQNLSGHNAIINSMAANAEDVLVSGADNGSLYFWDWKSGYNFQRLNTTVQPGSIDSENGIFDLCFDNSGSRLITAEADKTIKIYKEDDTATEESHPLNWRPDILRKKKF